jgi:4-hydroxybenzoate polyprenyltransferase
MSKSRPRHPDGEEPRAEADAGRPDDDAAAEPASTEKDDRGKAEPAGTGDTSKTDDAGKTDAATTATDDSGAETRPAAVRRGWTPWMLAQAAHPRQAVLTAVGMTVAAALADRAARELVLVFATVLVGQAILGWHNDIVDERADAAHERDRKPVGQGRLDTGTVWFALCVGVLLVVPLAVSNGTRAGIAYLVSVVVGMLGNIVPRRGVASFLPWAVSFALYPFFLSYGGWGGGSHGGPPQWGLVGLSAALGIGVHVLLALWGLVADNEDGWTYLPLKLGLRMGATRLLVATLLYCAVVVAAMLVVADRWGLIR